MLQTRDVCLSKGSLTAGGFGIGLALLASLLASGCSMSEEMKRIEENRRAIMQRQASQSTDLTGEQIFIRSCNTCHPSGKKGGGPSLEKLEEHFPDDKGLKDFIRHGKGNMPGQPITVINDKELDSLVYYLRQLVDRNNQDKK